MKQMINKRSIS